MIFIPNTPQCPFESHVMNGYPLSVCGVARCGGGGGRAVGRAARPARARRRVAGAAPPRAALRHQARERAERARAQARELHLLF